jgi:hypothetical protein
MDTHTLLEESLLEMFESHSKFERKSLKICVQSQSATCLLGGGGSLEASYWCVISLVFV